MRRTKMHTLIIAEANELGYFPTLEQADRIWRQNNLWWSRWEVANPGKRPGNLSVGPGLELYERSMRESIEAVMEPSKAPMACAT